MENKIFTCSDCKREFKNTRCFEYYCLDDEKCECYECEHCFRISCDECAFDGYQWLCKKCTDPAFAQK